MKKILLLLIPLLLLSDEQLIESISEKTLNYRYQVTDNKISLSSRFKIYKYQNNSLNLIYYHHVNVNKTVTEIDDYSSYKISFIHKF